MIQYVYYGDYIKIYLDLGIALLTISFAIAALINPYLKIWSSQITKRKAYLLKKSSKLTYPELSKSVKDIDEGVTKKDTITLLVFLNIIFYLIVIILSFLSLVAGGYHTLNIVDNNVTNNAILWSIPEDTKLIYLLPIKWALVISISLIMVGFILMIYLIKEIYKMITNLTKEEAEMPFEIIRYDKKIPKAELSKQNNIKLKRA